MSATPSERELLRLIEGLENQSLSPEEHGVLMEALEETPEARQQYVEYSRLSAMLRHEARSRRLLDQIPHLSRSSGYPARKYLSYSFMAAAAILLLFVGYGLVLRLQAPPLRIGLEVAPGTKWSVTHREGEGPPPGQAELTMGSHLLISQGVVEFTILDRVRGVLVGPAEVEVLSESSIRLGRGTGWFVVEEDGRGFVVQTSQLTVRDLGTEFGVKVPDQSVHPEEEVHVIKGSVEVSRVGGGEVLRLLAGESIRYSEADGLQEHPFDQDGFMKALPPGLPFIHWSFDELSGDRFASEGSLPGANLFPATLRNLRDPVPSSENHVAGRFGNALSLQGLGDWAETDWPGVAGNTPRTVSFWLKADVVKNILRTKQVPRRNVISWGLRSADFEGACWQLDLSALEGDSHGVSTDFGTFHGRMSTRSDVLDGQWHHVVSVYTGRELQTGLPEVIHHVDGLSYRAWPYKDQSAVPINTLTHLPASVGVRFGITALKPESNLPTFRGVIDEVYIVEGVLSPEEIRLLREENRSRLLK